MNSSHQTAELKSGRMENGFAAPYDFSISDVISEGWSRVHGFKTSIWGALGCYFLIMLVLSGVIYFIGSLLGGANDPTSNITTGLLRIVAQIILYPLYAGLVMMGIKRSVYLPVRAALVFRYYNAIWRITGVLLLSAFIIMLPSVFGGIVLGVVMSMDLPMVVSLLLGLVGFGFILLGIYFAWAYMFVVPLTTEKRLSIWRSLEVSRKAVTQHWWKIFLTTLAFVGIYLLSAIPLLIGLIWSLPLLIAAQGVLYRRVFGVEADLATNE